MRSSLFRGAADTAGDPDAAMKFDNTLLYGIVTMGVGPLAISGVKAAASGDSDEFSKQAGGFGVMVIAPYGIGRAIGYVRGPVVTVENPITNPVPELPPSPLPRMPGSPNAALPPVAIPPELIPITDNLFRIMFEEVTAVPAPVKKIQVIEGVQAGTDGTPTTGVSGTSTTNVPGVNTSPLPAPPKGTPPPGNCGLPNALGNAVDPATATLPEGPISATSGGFRLRNAGEGGGPKLVRLVTNCEECANLIGQNPGRLTPTGYPPDAVLTVVRDPIRLPNGEVIPVGGEILVNGRGQPTFNGQPIDLPSNTEFGFTPPPRWDQGQTLGLPSPALTLQPVAELPVGPAAAAGAAINAGRSPDR